MKRVILIILSILSIACQSAFAQGRGSLTGTVTLRGADEGEEDSPGVGAMIIVASNSSAKKDTLYAVVSDKGTFTIKNVPAGPANVKISLLGYDEIERNITVKTGENKIIAELFPSDVMLEEAVVRETANVINIKQDTLIFNPAAVKVNKGEMAIDVLQQMPGVSVTDDGVTILEESLAMVYIDGAMLFSNDPMLALEQLPAEEVAGIKSYSEYSNKDPNHVLSLTEEKQRVIDITTKNKPKMVVNGDFLAGAGFDTDTTYHKFRYRAGGRVNVSSESLQADLTFNVNNVNNAQVRQRSNMFRTAGGGGSADLRALSVSASVTRKWMSKEAKNFSLGQIGGSYSYSNNYRVNESKTQKIYFPTESYQSREYNSTSYSDVTSGTHNFSLDGRKSLKDGYISLDANASISDSRNNSRSTSYNQQDALPRQGTSSSTVSNTNSNSFSGNFGFSKGFNGKVYIGLSASAAKGNSEGVSAKIDTTTSTIYIKQLDIDSDGNSTSLSVSPSVDFRFTNRNSLSFSYSYDKDKSVTNRVAMDVSDPLNPTIDVENTEKLTNSTNTHTATVSFRQYFESIKANLRVNVNYNSEGLNKEDLYPTEDIYSHRFNGVTGNIRFGNDAIINHWNVNYRTNTSTPSLEQIRPRLDNSDLYSVTVGNSDLNQSRSHNLNFSYSTVLGKEAKAALANSTNRRNAGKFSTFSFNGSFRMNNDVIVSKRTYFAEDTYLPEYDYTMPAQSTLTTYENVDNSYSASGSANLDMQLKKINCVLSTNAQVSWDQSPSYVNEVYTMTDNLNPSLNIGLTSNFSRNIRFNVRGTGAYNYSNNSEKDAVSYFTERITVGFELNNILKHIYAGGNYNKTFTQGLSYSQMNDNILNLNIGAKFGPRNNLDVSIAAYDIFNKTTGFSTAMQSDYVQNSWTHNFGRYVMFTLAYRFNSMSKGGGSGSNSRGGNREGNGREGNGRGGYGGQGGGFSRF